MLEFTKVFAAFVVLCILDFSHGNIVSDVEWNQYKETFQKTYATTTAEANARFYYSYNKKLITNHNVYYDRGLRTYGLGINQFTDMRLLTFNALFPQTTSLAESFEATLPSGSSPIGTDFSFIDDLGLQSQIENQGIVCNSGWAYATAKAVEINAAFKRADLAPKSLSAQNLIDCAGQSTGCTKQVPQTGFDYLTQYGQVLYNSDEYQNNPNRAQQGMCILPQNPTGSISLQSYAKILNDDDTTMKQLINTQYPIVIEYNPTSFEFMHYKEGIFQQPVTSRGSHFMTVIGFGVDTAKSLNYFIVQNSFGTTWGEAGLIRIAYSNSKPLAKSAILPI